MIFQRYDYTAKMIKVVFWWNNEYCLFICVRMLLHLECVFNKINQKIKIGYK